MIVTASYEQRIADSVEMILKRVNQRISSLDDKTKTKLAVLQLASQVRRPGERYACILISHRQSSTRQRQ